MNFTRPPPGPPPSYASRFYARDLRPIVIALSVITSIWALLSGIGFFQSISPSKRDNQPTLAAASIALGAVYMLVFAISAFGTFAAVKRRTALMRIYTLLAAVSAVAAVGAGLARVVIHFVQKNNLISECQHVLTGDEVTYRFGWWGPVTHHVIDADEATDWCRKEWDHDSVSVIVSLLIVGFFAGLFCSIAFAYYRQLLDPTSAANAFRAPSNQARTEGAFPTHYNQAYGASVPNLGYGYNMPYAGGPQAQFAPPPGPPPAPAYENKGYGVGLEGQNKDHDNKNENPFADFDERDVTSRPAAGGRDHF